MMGERKNQLKRVSVDPIVKVVVVKFMILFQTTLLYSKSVS